MQTWEDLLQALLKLSANDRKKNAVVFNYHLNKFDNLHICVEGKPKFHLTIEGCEHGDA